MGKARKVHYYGTFALVEYTEGSDEEIDIFEEIPVCDHTSPVSGQYHSGPIPFIGPDEQERRRRGRIEG